MMLCDAVTCNSGSLEDPSLSPASLKVFPRAPHPCISSGVLLAPLLPSSAFTFAEPRQLHMARPFSGGDRHPSYPTGKETLCPSYIKIRKELETVVRDRTLQDYGCIFFRVFLLRILSVLQKLHTQNKLSKGTQWNAICSCLGAE